MRTLLGLAVACALIVSPLVHAAPPFTGEGPELIRLTGYPGPAKDDGRSTQALVIDDDGTQRAFQLLNVEVVTGRRSAASVRDSLEPLKPSLFLRAPKAVLAPYRDAPDGQVLVLDGWLDAGRNFMASSISAGGAPRP